MQKLQRQGRLVPCLKGPPGIRWLLVGMLVAAWAAAGSLPGADGQETFFPSTPPAASSGYPLLSEAFGSQQPAVGQAFDGRPMAGQAAGNPTALPRTAPQPSGSDAVRPAASPEPWTWHVVPDGLIYRSYLAGVKEPRFASQWMYDSRLGGVWDVTLGGRVGIVRYGTADGLHPDGWQVDIEGAAFPRLDMENSLDVMSNDYRFGIPLTYGCGPFQTKLAYAHICSHLGDEYMVKHPGVDRINYVRNGVVWGNSYYCHPDVRVYGEVGWAFETDGGCEPWEFQFGVEYSPAAPTGGKGVPFAAVNAHLRQDVNFGGNMVFQTGLQWRGTTGQLFRMGMQYYAGKSDQYEFFDQSENKIGLALWYDY